MAAGMPRARACCFHPKTRPRGLTSAREERSIRSLNGAAEAAPLQAIARSYQTRQAGLRIIGEPALQPKALANSGTFETTPLTRHLSSECSLLSACRRACWGV